MSGRTNREIADQIAKPHEGTLGFISNAIERALDEKDAALEKLHADNAALKRDLQSCRTFLSIESKMNNELVGKVMDVENSFPKVAESGPEVALLNAKLERSVVDNKANCESLKFYVEENQRLEKELAEQKAKYQSAVLKGSEAAEKLIDAAIKNLDLQRALSEERERAKAYREWVESHGRHSPQCGLSLSYGRLPCDCGFTKLLSPKQPLASEEGK